MPSLAYLLEAAADQQYADDYEYNYFNLHKLLDAMACEGVENDIKVVFKGVKDITISRKSDKVLCKDVLRDLLVESKNSLAMDFYNTLFV